MFVTHRHLLRARRPAPARGAADLLPLLLLAAAACASAQVVTPTARSRATVGIVGAGMSGIRAATVLADSGVDYVVLEADSKVGGRMRNTEIAPGQFVELGANWVQGLAGNPIYDLALSCGLQSTPQNWDSVVTFDETGKPLADSKIPWKRFDTASACVSSTVKSNIANGVHPDLDVRAALRVCGWNPLKPIDYAVEWYSENFEWAEAPEMVGASMTHPNAAYSDFADADLFTHQQSSDGISRLVTCLANRSSVLPKVRLNTKVTSFQISSSNTVVVRTTAGTYEFDYVINTLPIAVMQRNLDTLFPTSTASLWPAAKRAALMQFRMATYMKIFLKFETMFWDPNAQFILQAPNKGSTYQILWQNLSPASGGFLPGSNIIMMTVTDVVSAHFEGLTNQAVLENVVARLQEIYPQANTTSKLVGSVVPRWYTNELFGGSYTNWPAGMTDASYELWRAPIGTPGPLTTPGKILFAGEAACKRMTGYMQGAYGAGERSAKQILQAINKFAGDPDATFCEKQLTTNGKPLGNKARGSGLGK